MKLTTSSNETKNLHLKSNIFNFLKPENIFLLIQIKQIKKQSRKKNVMIFAMLLIVRVSAT